MVAKQVIASEGTEDGDSLQVYLLNTVHELASTECANIEIYS